MICVKFPAWNLTLSLPEGTSVAVACRTAGHPLELVCGGRGTCGKCLVEIRDGQGLRMVRACRTEVTDGMEIRTFPALLQVLILDRGEALPPLSGPLPSCYTGRYGAACDLGSTTVVLYLWDLQRRAPLGRWSAMNAQASLGADVVSRLQAALDPELGTLLRRKAVETVNGLLTEAAACTGIATEELCALTLAGNSAMQHLFLGFPVEQLARAPYRCYERSPVSRTAAQLGLALHPDARVDFLPLVGGFIGGDTVAAMSAADLSASGKKRLLIDLGTNGELVLYDGTDLTAASAAAGPAMEGAGIACGMRGAAGAIEGVSLHADALMPDVIGGGAPMGICGSGLVDLAAVLVEQELVSPGGRLSSAEEFLAAGGSPSLARRLVEREGQRAFLVAGTAEDAVKDIYLTQSDIRALQLSKGAIAAAAQLLLSSRGLVGEDLTEVLLAGAFGSYIRLSSASRIGLIPDYPGVAVRAVGNAAGVGAQRYLLDRTARAAACDMAARTAHLELTSLPDFTMTFARAMELCPMSEMEFDEVD